MKKITRFLAAVTAAFMSVCAVNIPKDVNAAIDEAALSELIAQRTSPSYKFIQFDDHGYYADMVSNLSVQVGQTQFYDENFSGRYITLYREMTDTVSIIFPDALDEINVTFVESFKGDREEVLKDIAEKTGGDVTFKREGRYAVFYSADFDQEKIDKFTEACRQYEDDNTIYKINSTPKEFNSIETFGIRSDKLFYYSEVSRKNRQEFDFEAVSEYLKEEGINCRIAKTTQPHDGRYRVDPVTEELIPLIQDYYTVEITEDHSIDDLYRIASLIKERFGYVMTPENKIVSTEYGFSSPEHISADYVQPLKGSVSEDAETEPDSVMYGDLNYDAQADLTDLSILSLHLLNDDIITDSELIEAADVKYDNEIDVCDIAFFKQYLLKDVNTLGKYADLSDVTGDCTFFNFRASGYYKYGCFEISDMDEFTEYFGNHPLDIESINDNITVSEEFFENNRLAVMNEMQTVNGIKITVSSVKTDADGNIHLFYDRFYPHGWTTLAGTTCWFTVIPGNPHNDSTAEAHYNDTYALYDLTYDCSMVNTTKVNVSGSYPESSGIITSMEEYKELTDSGIEPAGLTDRFSISADFFKTNDIIYYTSVQTDPYVRISVSYVTLDYKNNLKIGLSRVEPTLYDDDRTEFGQENIYWFSAAVVPKKLLSTAKKESFETVVNSSQYRGFNIDNNMVSIKNALTEFPTDPDTRGTVIVSSLMEFDEFNAKHSGKYSHIRDEMITEDFFTENVIVIVTENSENSNEVFNLQRIRNDNYQLYGIELVVEKFINTQEPDGVSNEWHLAAAVSKDSLKYDADMIALKTVYQTKEAYLGSYE